MTEHDRAEFRHFGTLLKWAASLSFVLISLGSLVRASHSGLSCPDWPLCYGQAVPMFDVHIFLEWFHRLIAGGLGFLMLFACVRLFKSKLLRKALGLQIAVAACLLMVQIVLGGLTVLKLLDPSTVSAHLLNAILFFTVLVWMAMRASALATPRKSGSTNPTNPIHPAVGWGFTAATVLIFLQIGVGGSVSSRFAGLACADFPTCNGAWSLPAALPQALQMIHREIAFFILVFTTVLALLSGRLVLPQAARRAVRLVPALIAVQILLGIVNVYYGLPIWASTAHLANAAAIYAVLLMATIALHAQRKGYDYRATARHRGASGPSAARAARVAQLPTPN